MKSKNLMLGALLLVSLLACGKEVDAGSPVARLEQQAASDRIVYADGLGSGWSDWSWATRNLANRSPVQSGTRSIAVTYGPWKGLYLHHAGIPGDGLSFLQFQVNGGSNTNPALVAKITVAGAEKATVPVATYCAGARIPSNQWTRCQIPLSALGWTGGLVDGVILQEFAGKALRVMYVDEIQLVGAAVPPAPSQLAVTPSAGQVALSWSSVSGATGYHVYRSTSSTGSFSRMTYQPVATNSFVDTAVTAGSTYWYRITSVAGSGESAPSSSASATVPAPPPAPSLPIAQVAADRVTLTWSAVGGATGYHVYRSGASGSFVRLTSSPISTRSYEDRVVMAGGTYSYAISAVNSAGEGQRSPSVGVTLPTAPPPPEPTAETVWVYRDALAPGWVDGTWAAGNLGATSPVFAGNRSISASFGGWQGVFFMHPGVSTAGLTAVTLRVHGGTAGGGAALRVRTVGTDDAWSDGTDLGPTCAGGAIAAGRWTECTIPLSDIATPGETITGIAIQEWRGGSISTIYLDEIGFLQNSDGNSEPPPTEPPPDDTGTNPPGPIDMTGLLPADRQTRWLPGLNAVGGIPADNDRVRPASIYLPSGNPYGGFSVDPALGNGAGDVSGAIQAALNAAGAQASERNRKVVLLKAGTYSIRSSLNVPGYVTIRGQGTRGASATRLVKPRGTATSVINLGHLWVKNTTPVDLAADAAHGSRSVTLTRNPGYQVGELVFIDQIVDTARIGSWWNPARQGNANDSSRGWFSRQNRPTGQVLEIESIAGNTLTFSTPLRLPYYTSNQAQVVRFSGGVQGGPMVPTKKWSGVEDLYLYGGEGGDGGGNIHLFATSYSWVKNVESEGSEGTSVAFDSTFRCVLRDSFVHSTVNPSPGGGGYGIGMLFYASDNLVENSISWNFNKVIIMRATGGGNVIGYNYFEDGWGSGYPTIPEVGLNASHYATPHHELFEGNEAFNIAGDSYWGNSIYNTFFRNHVTGRRRSIPPLRLRDEVQRRFIEVPDWHLNFSYIGNVLGSSNMTASPQSGFVYEARAPWSWDPVPMWAVGVDGSSQDSRVVQTTLRHGNYDYVTRGIVWDPSISRRTLPPSLYLEAKPAFFGQNPWPWVTPENGSRPYAALPARARFDAMYGSN